MGIKDLLTFSEKNSGKEFTFKIDIRDISNTRIAIDGNGLVHTYASKVFFSLIGEQQDPLEEPDRRKFMTMLFSQLLRVLIFFIEKEITPVLVWDGVHVIEKKGTQQNRREQREKKQSELVTMREALLATHPLKRGVIQVNEFKKALASSLHLTSMEVKVVKDFFENIGIPSLVATSDGESLCASLCRQSYCSCVWSRDSDGIALGTPILVTNRENTTTETTYMRIIKTDLLLEGLGLNEEEMRDFCIMLGCDYNQRIKGVGPVKSYQMIKKYRNIDRMIESGDFPKLDFSVLNHVRCRELLTPEKILIDEKELNIDAEKIKSNDTRDLFEYQGIIALYNFFKQSVSLLV